MMFLISPSKISQKWFLVVFLLCPSSLVCYPKCARI